MVSSPQPPAPDLPDGAALLALERRARQGGSGLDRDRLAGLWQLRQVWPRKGTRPMAVAASLMRGLGASLEIRPLPAQDGLGLVNSVRLGRLALRFEGEGVLEGRRPLLTFGFARCRLQLGERLLNERPLAPADHRRRPFFALIGSGSTPAGLTWLAARGRGGGLALWCRQEAGR